MHYLFNICILNVFYIIWTIVCNKEFILLLYPIVHIDGIHHFNRLLDFPNTSSLNLFHFIHFTKILMIATLVNFHDREVKSNMPYFGSV